MRAYRRGLLALAAAFGLAAFAHSAAATTLTLDEARALARDAAQAGNFPLAQRVATGLAEARPEDPEIWAFLAVVEGQMGRTQEMSQAARKAFRLSERPDQKVRAADSVVRAALAEGRYGAAQYWLRRAYQIADEETTRAEIATAFQRVRRAAPVTARFDLSVAPTSNLNGGAEDAKYTIDGKDTAGTLSGDSLALSGTTASAMAEFSFRLGQTERSLTSFDVFLYRTVNWLSDEAKDKAPDAKGSDYDIAFGEIGVTHRMADVPWYLPDRVTFAVGQTWSGDEASSVQVKATLSRRYVLGEKTGLRVTAGVTERGSLTGGDNQTLHRLQLGLDHRLNWGFLRASVTQIEARSAANSATYSQTSAQLSFAQAEAIRGMRFSGYLGWSAKHYDKHPTATSYALPDRPRDDETLRAGLSLSLETIDYLGFTPVISWSAEDTVSNFSRYESNSQGLSLGFSSSF